MLIMKAADSLADSGYVDVYIHARDQIGSILAGGRVASAAGLRCVAADFDVTKGLDADEEQDAVPVEKSWEYSIGIYPLLPITP